MGRRRRLLLLLTAMLLAACGGYSPYYTSDPIEAWVVDAETGAPIEGAIVTANWQLVAFSFDTGGRKLRQLAVMETVTDKNGRFAFPGFTKLNPSLDELREGDPQILVFKPGYEFGAMNSAYPAGGPYPGAHRHSAVIGKTFKLGKAKVDPKTYALHLSILMSILMPIVESDSSDIGRMLISLTCEDRRLARIDPKARFSVPNTIGKDPTCAHE